MLLKVFRENQAFIILLLFLLSIILWSAVALDKSFEPGINTLYNYSGFYLFPGLRLINNNIWLSTAINILLVLISGLYFSRITYKYQLIQGRNLMPMLIFFFMSLPWFSTFTGLSYPLLSLPVLLLVIDILFSSAEEKNLSFSYFNSAMILSLVSIINYYLVFYILFIFFLYFRLRGTRWRELVFILLGAIVPYFILFGLMYLFNEDISNFLNSISVLWQYKITFDLDSIHLIFGAFLFLLFLIGSWQAATHFAIMKILTRKYSVTLFVLFSLSALIIFVVPAVNKDSVFFIATPLSFLFGFYFTTCRINIFNQVLLLLFMLGNTGLLVMSFF